MKLARARTGLIATAVAVSLFATGCGGTEPSTDAEAAADAAASEAGDTETDEAVAAPVREDPDPEPDATEAEPLSVAVTATADALMGVNVAIDTTGFRWAPEHASGEAVTGEGHAHLYVDGEKQGRLYGPDVHLGLDPGEHEIRVTLNGNDHEDLLVDGEVVEAVTTVTVPEPPSAMGGHGDTSGHEATAPMSVAVEATPDAKAGVNVRIVTTGFRWAPEHASGEHVDGEGHAHLYVDGEKVGRVYGEALHLMLDPGAYELRLTLNGNDHRDYLVGGEVVEATVSVEVPEGTMAGH
jgi:hypothetical protein